MLSRAENDRFVRVGAGTPMGELLRRYWQPIAAAGEFDDGPRTKAIKILGENLVLYKDKGGHYGLVDRHCPHRRADMRFGILEDCGIRCSYHGWMFDEQGKCLAQPFEDQVNAKARFKDKITLKAYPVRENAGLLWAYMGPLPAPELPHYEPFNWDHGFKQLVFAVVPCNWFQCQENSIDPVHFEWAHANWGKRLRGDEGKYVPTHVKLGFEEFDQGFSYKRVREDTDENDQLWTVGRVCLWPNGMFTGDHFEWRVPIDDENTLSVTWSYTMADPERDLPELTSIPWWYGPVTHPETGEWITSHVMNQDFSAWVGQGVIAERSFEHLGQSDLGIVKLRKALKVAMDVVEKGAGDPKGVIRDPEAAKCVPLPTMTRSSYEEYKKIAFGKAGESWTAADEEGVKKRTHSFDYKFQFGQPDHIRKQFLEFMGFDK